MYSALCIVPSFLGIHNLKKKGNYVYILSFETMMIFEVPYPLSYDKG